MDQTQEYVLTPRYEDDLCRSIGVLQQLQMLVSNNATLDDVAQVVQSFQQKFGVQEQLESVIQCLVSQSLGEQMAHRKTGRGDNY